jgi:Family of unknown function (DUF6489)
MKVTITVDCTPEEARTFLGFPDLTAIQQQMMQIFQDHIRQQMSADPETVMRAWLGPGYQGFTDMQRNWWQQMFKTGEPKAE